MNIEDINELDQDITGEILNDLLGNITNLEKQGNGEIQNNGEFSGVEFDQIFDFNEINEISINIV
ncbi:11125_t:CDS:2 [Entrophospora sp. SA101]|nr:11125_t:CDS:2 [Entrophospora sp. SA101]CAJ0927007.1 14137_t:CDS:2 [Entrophospora sp. SA101]